MKFCFGLTKSIAFVAVILILSGAVLAMSNSKSVHKSKKQLQNSDTSEAIRSIWLDKDKGDNILRAAQELNFNSVVVHWNKETTPDFIKRAKSFGFDTYVWVYPTFPQEDKDKYSQVMSKQEEAIWEKEIKLARENKLFTSDYQGGGEPLDGNKEVLIYDVPCFHHREVVEDVERRVKDILESAPDLAGIALDMFGYKNYHCCYCDTSKELFEQYYKKHQDMDRDSAWEKFNLETLVDFQNEICNYARSIRPDVKITNHVWPTYLPNPTYGNMLDLDYCAQTAAWFFKPYWSDEKISRYTKLFVNQAKKYHKRSQGVPFIGYYNREGYNVKSPERLAHEVDVILSSSNSKNLAIHCFGDIVKTPAAFNALKEVLIKHGIVDVAATKKKIEVKTIEHSSKSTSLASVEIVSLTAENVVVLPPTKKIWDAAHEVISISPTSKAWHAKWRVFDSLAIGEYKVRAFLKLKGQKEGYGIRFGIYSPKANKEVFSKVIRADKIPQSDAYQWVDLGKANITDDAGAYFFATSGGDNSFDTFFLSEVEFVRVK